MTLASGTRIGPYRIGAKLGEGGMGEVYRASDSNLKREVAVKVLPAAFVADEERLERFEREARVLAQLHHPNIASIFDLEEWDGGRALVMELVEGEDLAVAIARGALPLAETLSLARQIAEALEFAHEQGVVHRDLKPANIKVRADGAVKILDFGLAKAMDPASGPSADIANSPTMTARGTELGVILGTAAYMAPEQARGKAVDRRADIWAFGVVLYEMLTGRRAFAGDGVTDVLAAVLRQDIDWSALPRDTPPRLRRLLERCLDRDVKQRLRDVGEARIEIARIESGAPDTAGAAIAVPASSGRRWRHRLTWLGLGVATAIAGFVVLGLPGRGDEGGWDNRVVRLAFVPPPSVSSDEGIYDSTVVSPDGTKLVFTGRTTGGKRQLWLRSLDALGATALPGTEEAIEPFWSPDSRAVGFGADGKLKRVDLAGGQPEALADAPRLTGGTWSRDGVIVFGAGYGAGLLQVPAAGGPAKAAMKATRPPGESHSLPRFLPDGRHFVFRVLSGGPPRIAIGALDSADTKPLLADAGAGGALYAPPGWLLYVRNDALVVQAFDAGELAFRGEPIPVSTGLPNGMAFGSGRFSISDNGVLVLQNPRSLQYQLVWFDRAGQTIGSVGESTVVTSGQSPELSPDGKRIALQRADPKTRNMDIWLVDVEREAFNRLTVDPLFDQLPVWTPDGRSLLIGRQGLRRLAIDGSADDLLLPQTAYPMSVSPDGRFLVYMLRGDSTRADLWAMPLAGDRKPYPLLRTEFDEDQAQISPDGRWLAYSSDVTGRREVYVRPLVGARALGEPTLISNEGGIHPRWRRDGRELFYIEAPVSASLGALMAASVNASGAHIQFAAPHMLFETHMVPNAASAEYDVSPDGQRFLVGSVIGEADSPPVSLVLNWTAELKP